MKKRLLAMFLALALCMGLCVPALAVEAEHAEEEDIKSTFTILRNGTINELEGRYQTKALFAPSYGAGAREVDCQVFGQGDSWTITNTGSKAISYVGRTDYTISFTTMQYVYVPGEGFQEVGGMSDIDAEGRQVHAPDEGTRLANLKAGESITIPAASFESEGPYSGNLITELAISIYFEGASELSPNGIMMDYVLYFMGDDARKAAMDKAQKDPTPAAFNDVPAWCSPAVDWAVAQNITNGKGGGRFAPNDQCTNAEILTFLWRAAGEPKEWVKVPIANTQESDFFYDAAQWASDRGMIDPGAFDPHKPCTRGSAMRYIWNAFGEMGADGADVFSDVSDQDELLYGAVNFALACGITNGYPDGTFRPNNTCTRGEIVTFLHRAYVPEASLSFDF